MGINGCRSARNIELRKLDDRLLLVCTLGKADAAEISALIKDGADIHAMRQPEGKTALHLAAHSGGLLAVKVGPSSSSSLYVPQPEHVSRVSFVSSS